MPEVEVAMITSSPTAAEISAKSSRLTSRRSGPFSCTKSTPASALPRLLSKLSRATEAASARPLRPSRSQRLSARVRSLLSAPGAGSVAETS